jgi:hypothetical protein
MFGGAIALVVFALGGNQKEFSWMLTYLAQPVQLG